MFLHFLFPHSFTANITVGQDEYTYTFKVCDDAGGMKDAGVVQRDKSGKQVRIGNYTATQAFAGSEDHYLQSLNFISGLVSKTLLLKY